MSHCQKFCKNLSTICLFGDGCIRYYYKKLVIAEQQNDISKIQTVMEKLLWGYDQWFYCRLTARVF